MPTTNEPESTGLSTTELAPIFASLPMLRPPNTLAPDPMTTLLPTIGRNSSLKNKLHKVLKGN